MYPRAKSFFNWEHISILSSWKWICVQNHILSHKEACTHSENIFCSLKTHARFELQKLIYRFNTSPVLSPGKWIIQPEISAFIFIKMFREGKKKMVVGRRPSYPFTQKKSVVTPFISGKTSFISEKRRVPCWTKRKRRPHASKGCVNGQFLNRFRYTKFHFHHWSHWANGWMTITFYSRFPNSTTGYHRTISHK